MKFSLSHSYYNIFKPEIPNMYTDDVK